MSYKIKTSRNGLIWSAILSALLLAGCGGGEVKRDETVLAYPPPPEPTRFFYERTITSSFDVKEITGADKLKVFATGTLGTATGLGKPWGGRVVKTFFVRLPLYRLPAPATASRRTSRRCGSLSRSDGSP